MSSDILGRPTTERRPAAANQRYQIEEIQPRHHEIIRFLVMGRLTHRQIAEIVGCTVATITNVANSEITKRKIQAMQASRDVNAVDVAKHIQDSAPDAIKLLDKVMNAKDEFIDAPLRVRVDIANRILNRAGFSEKVQVESKGLLGIIIGETIEDIKQRARLARKTVDEDDGGNGCQGVSNRNVEDGSVG